jgi:hypothetical protein
MEVESDQIIKCQKRQKKIPFYILYKKIPDFQSFHSHKNVYISRTMRLPGLILFTIESLGLYLHLGQATSLFHGY